MVMTAAQLTRALGGRWHGRYGTARCLVHDDRSPSLSIVDGKEGPVVTCFAGCDWREVRAELRRRGFVDDGIRLHQRAPDRNFDRPKDTKSPKPAEGRVGITDTEDTTRALAIWAEAKQLGDIALKYCISRGISELSLPDIDGVLRFHPHCPFGRGERHPCIVALWTDAITNQAQAIHRTALTPDGKKLGRMSLGPTAGCVLRLWPDELVTLGLVIGEGLETVLAAATRIEHRGTLLQPAWAVGDAGHLAKFPVLAGIAALTILVDHDEAGQRAARECRERWLAAGREVTALIPNDFGQDFNDIVQKDPVS
jgi:putative DNA primase/helicase